MRQLNAGEPSHHYEDFVVPFRQKYPDYQRYWRWLRGLREIREKIEGSLSDLVPRVQRALERGHALTCRGKNGIVQVPARTTETAGSAARFAETIEQLFGQLQSLIRKLSGAAGPA